VDNLFDMDITSKTSWQHIRIYFSGCLHLSINLHNLVIIQSWISNSKQYYIQFSWSDGANVTCGYDCIDKWKSVLDILDKKWKYNNVKE